MGAIQSHHWKLIETDWVSRIIRRNQFLDSVSSPSNRYRTLSYFGRVRRLAYQVVQPGQLKRSRTYIAGNHLYWWCCTEWVCSDNFIKVSVKVWTNQYHWEANYNLHFNILSYRRPRIPIPERMMANRERCLGGWQFRSNSIERVIEWNRSSPIQINHLGSVASEQDLMWRFPDSPDTTYLFHLHSLDN